MQVDEMSTINVDEGTFKYGDGVGENDGLEGNFEKRCVEMLTMAGFKGVVKSYLIAPEEGDVEDADDDDIYVAKLLAKLECSQFTAVIEDETEYFVRDHKIFGNSYCSRGYWEFMVNGHTYRCNTYDSDNWTSWEEK